MLALSRHKRALWQLRLAALTQKHQVRVRVRARGRVLAPVCIWCMHSHTYRPLTSNPQPSLPLPLPSHSAPPPPPSDRFDDAAKVSDATPPHNIDLLYAPPNIRTVSLH